MSSEQPRKRVNNEAPGEPLRKKGKHKKRPSEQLPETQFEHLHKAFGNHLSSKEYSDPIVADIKQPLKQFHRWLDRRSIAGHLTLTNDLLTTLKKIVDLVATYKGPLHIAQENDRNKTSGNDKTSGETSSETSSEAMDGDEALSDSERRRRLWTFSTRERYQPMVDFARVLRTVRHMTDPIMSLTRMHTAIKILETKLRRIEELNKILKKSKSKEVTEKKDLRRKLDFLIATRRVVLDRDPAALSLKQLVALVRSRQEFLRDCKVYNLEDLNKNHNCKLCERNKRVVGPDPLPAYKSPLDHSPTPQIRGLFRSGPVSVEDVKAHNFRYVTGGTTFGMVTDPDNGLPELALFIDHPNYHLETPEHCLRLERLAYLLHLGAEYSTPCYCNKAQQALPKELQGNMGLLGNRKERFKGIPWGMYATPARFKKKRNKEWADFQTDYMPELATIINSLFLETTGAEVVTETAIEFVVKFKLPPFGATSIMGDKWPKSAGCNLTISFNKFSNECHLDGDKYRYVFSVYVFVDKKTGRLITDPKKIENCMKGGYLIWPDLHLALKIVDCTGVVLLFWRGSHERHCTILSEVVDESIIRYGTSLQVNKQLFDSVQRHNQQLDAILEWELNDTGKECPAFPIAPMDLSDLIISHDEDD